MHLRSAALFALATVASAGCYDSQWGQQKAAQQRNAAISAPAALRTEERTEHAPARVQKLRVRALVTRSFTAHVVDAPRHLRDLFDDVNRVTERDLSMHLELVETRTWDLANEDDIDKSFDALRTADDGDGVDWVAGFVGALPRASRSFHEVGKGALVGKHVVVRAPSSAERHDNIEKSFDELPEEQRRELEKRLRRHRAAAVFLHEIGHTLGCVHERSAQSIMFPDYNGKMSGFGESANDVMRAALAKRGASEAAMATDIVAALKRAPDGVFVEAERDRLLSRLESMSPSASAKGRRGAADDTPAAPREVAVPDTPELAGADRERFVEAYRACPR